MRERQNNPDAVDLSMRGWVEAYRPHSKASDDAAIGLFEPPLALDPNLVAGDLERFRPIAEAFAAQQPHWVSIYPLSYATAMA